MLFLVGNGMVAEGMIMGRGIVEKLKRLAKVMGPLLAIEAVLPGGTLIVVTCLLMGRGLPRLRLGFGPSGAIHPISR